MFELQQAYFPELFYQIPPNEFYYETLPTCVRNELIAFTNKVEERMDK